MTGRVRSKYWLGRALDEVDALADFTVTYEGVQVRLREVPYFLECQHAWAEAKSRRALFEWADFVAFFREMVDAIPPNSGRCRFVVIDSDGDFVRDNLRWEPIGPREL